MALQLMPGRGPYLPEMPRVNPGPTFGTVAIIDATAEKVAFIGYVFNKDRATKTLDKIHFRTGAVTFNVLSVLRVSVQLVDGTAGPPARPDGTQAQFRDIAGVALAANTWTTTGLVTDDGTDTGVKRSMPFGEEVCIVFEYSTFTALDSVIIAAASDVGLISGPLHRPASSLFTASWATLTVLPNVILEFSDGTFGTLDGAVCASAMSSLAYNSGTAGADEYAMEFSFPYPTQVDGGWLMMNAAGATSNFEIILYDGTTPMTDGTIAFDANTVVSAAAARMLRFTFPAALELTASTIYRLALKPTTTNNVTLYYFDVSAAGHLQALDGGEALCLTSCLNSGAWAAATTTRRPWMGLRLCAVDDGAGGGGGGGPLVGGRLVA